MFSLRFPLLIDRRLKCKFKMHKRELRFYLYLNPCITFIVNLNLKQRELKLERGYNRSSACALLVANFQLDRFLSFDFHFSFRKREISHPSVVKKSLKTRRREVIKIVKKDLTEIESAAATVTVIAGETVTRTVIRTVTEIVTAIGTVTEGETGIETGSVIVIRIGIVKGIGIVTEIVIVSVIVTGIVTVIVTSTVTGVVTGAVNGIAIVIVIVIETVGVTRIAIEIATGIVKGRRRRKGDAIRMIKTTSARKTEMM